MALQVVRHDFADRTEKALYVVEFRAIERDEFDKKWSSPTDEGLYSLPLDPVAKIIYRVVPPISGLNGR